MTTDEIKQKIADQELVIEQIEREKSKLKAEQEQILNLRVLGIELDDTQKRRKGELVSRIALLETQQDEETIVLDAMEKRLVEISQTELGKLKEEALGANHTHNKNNAQFRVLVDKFIDDARQLRLNNQVALEAVSGLYPSLKTAGMTDSELEQVMTVNNNSVSLPADDLQRLQTELNIIQKFGGKGVAY